MHDCALSCKKPTEMSNNIIVKEMTLTYVVACSAGQSANPAMDACVDCPRGSYQSLPNQNSCEGCPTGTTTRDPAATSFEQCEGTSHYDTCSDSDFVKSGHVYMLRRLNVATDWIVVAHRILSGRSAAGGRQLRALSNRLLQKQQRQ